MNERVEEYFALIDRKRHGHPTQVVQNMFDMRNIRILKEFLDGKRQRVIAKEYDLTPNAVNDIIHRTCFKLLKDSQIKLMRPLEIREKYKDELLQKITLSV